MAASLRLHWLFTARVLPHQLARARQRSRLWMHAADAVMSVLLLAAALLALQGTAPDWRRCWPASAPACWSRRRMIEPATTEGAFGPEA